LSSGPRIAGAGVCTLDHIVVSPQVSWGGTAAVSNYLAQGGGLIGTALVACARLGADCALFTLLGDDQVGDQILAELVDESIDCNRAVRVPGGESPFSFIHVDETSGERTIFYRGGTNLKGVPVDPSDLADFQALLVDEIYLGLSLSAARAARSLGIPVIADLVPAPGNDELLKMTDVLIAPRDYLRHLGSESDTDTALDAIHALGPTTAVITLGADGWVYSDSASRGAGKAFAVDVVDTTGAGDAFHGAFAYAKAMAWDTRRCCEFASAVASIKCTKPGGRTGLPSLAETVDFLAERL
jgi:sulfofructose kinase